MYKLNLVIALAIDELTEEECRDGISESRKMELLAEYGPLVPNTSPEIFLRALETQIQTRYDEVSAYLVDETDERVRHWLTPEIKNNGRFWPEYLSKMHNSLQLPARVCRRIDEDTDNILELTGDPKETQLATKGLVIGDVQSGKTSNFTGLISKAADAGYKVIIVTTGILETLRKQTQERLERDFVGRKSPGNSLQFRSTPVVRVSTMTTCSDDFKKDCHPAPSDSPSLFVIKKNVAILKRLHKHISDNIESYQKLPLLFIDDEADNASINTNEISQAADGSVQNSPTATNMNIRKILKLFHRSAYVGYTATPYANIFIDPFSEHVVNSSNSQEEALLLRDLFPKDFIYPLINTNEYIGAEKLFGLGDENEDITQDTISARPTDHMVHLLDEEGEERSYVQAIERGGNRRSSALPSSLLRAMYTFLLARAIHEKRGRGEEFCGMLIHVSRLRNAQNKVYKQVKDKLEEIITELKLRGGETTHYNDLPSLRSLWLVWEEQYEGKIPERWDDIINHLTDYNFLNKFETFKVNSDKIRELNEELKAFDYSQLRKGAAAIVVGGNCLARGITIEGLTVSYFLRKSTTFDALMQMGRWFGYRNGYDDICRLFIDRRIVNYFSQIAYATKELKESINEMHKRKMSPLSFGLKVRNGVGGLLITSRNKMRSTSRTFDDSTIDLSGSLIETHRIPGDAAIQDENNNAMMRFICDLDSLHGRYERKSNETPAHKGIFFWKSVSSKDVHQFLKSLKAMYWSSRELGANGDTWNSVVFDYLEAYEEIDVTLLSLNPQNLPNNHKELKISSDITIYPYRRNPECNNSTKPEIIFNKARFFSKGDEIGCITNEQADRLKRNENKRELTEISGLKFRELEGRKPLLMLAFAYLPSNHEEGKSISQIDVSKFTKLVCAYGISCPGFDSRGKKKMPISYTQNKINELLNQELHKNEIDE